MAKKYKDYDLSTPEKRGYAVRKAFFEGPDETGSGAESGNPHTNMYGTNVEQNIGPRLDMEGVSQNKAKYTGDKNATASKKREGEWQKGFDKAKAESQEPTGPNYKKGGKVSSASKRADGIAIRGKTRA